MPRHGWRSVKAVRERTSPDGTITTRSRHACADFDPVMPGTLFVVSTPIGNLEDITLRALRVLREADLIAAEDTRQTGKLLAHFGIDKPMVSYHEHNEAARTQELVAKLEGGANIALVSDAGTPLVSD